jgi:hypothetical protein
MMSDRFLSFKFATFILGFFDYYSSLIFISGNNLVNIIEFKIIYKIESLVKIQIKFVIFIKNLSSYDADSFLVKLI